MKRQRTVLLLLAVVLCLTAVATLLALPEQAPNALSIPWWTVDGGGGTSSSSVFTVSGAAGQFDAGQQMTGGSFTLTGGFWNRTTGNISGGESQQIYLPLIRR
ncbi:MAG: hypothetical protein IPM39_11475 [Chloroflexi bacterium]|nr:hypothetical protein [Chloroflexota bacterium]